jgi:hypothetical protein
MARNKKTDKKPIEQYDHKGKKRVNNPPVGLVTPETDQETGKKTYAGRSLLPRQVFFPMAGEKEGWARLGRNLKAEIDEELIEAYRGTVSLPFEAGGHKRVAVKIVDDRGIESLKIIEVE